MKATFSSKRDGYISLLEELDRDRKLHTISRRFAEYAGYFRTADSQWSSLEDVGFSRSDWSHYNDLLDHLGIEQVSKIGQSGHVLFKIDPESLFNGDSAKGIYYSLDPPVRLLNDLDRYTLSRTDPESIVFKEVEPPWYLFLSVSK